jgi:hypothetical protein
MVVVIGEQPFVTRHGFTLTQMHQFFRELARLPDDNGTATAARAIVDTIRDIEQAPIQLNDEHAMALLSAGTVAHYLEIMKKKDRNSLDEAVLLCLKTAMSMSCRIEMTQLNLLSIATQILNFLKNGLNTPPYARAVLEQIVKTAEQGGYEDAQQLRGDLLAYIAQLQRADYPLENRTQAITACCIALSLFH